MEHCTVSTTGEFSDIQKLIDEADFFILLLGKEYGSCDPDGVSWTEREYQYAFSKKMPIVAIICNELIPNLEADPANLSEQDIKQVEFCKKITFARKISTEFGLKTILSQFITYNHSKCVGWIRVKNATMSESQLARWSEKKRVYDIGGVWYHVHLSGEDENYVRVGTITVQQDFTPDNYHTLRMDGLNYSIEYYDTEKAEFKENRMKSSKFTGEYNLRDNGEIFGVFNSKREFNGTFNLLDVTSGCRRGTHDLQLDVYADATKRIEGWFHDEAPSPKMGRIFMFRDKGERDQFLLENRGTTIEKR